MPQPLVPMVSVRLGGALTAVFLVLLTLGTQAQDVPIGTGTQAYYQLVIEQEGSSRTFEPSAFAAADLASIGQPDSFITIGLMSAALITKVAYRIVHGNFGYLNSEILTLIPGAGLIPSEWVEVYVPFSIKAQELQDSPETVVHQFTTIESNSAQTDFNINPAFVELRITHRRNGERVIRLPIRHGC